MNGISWYNFDINVKYFFKSCMSNNLKEIQHKDFLKATVSSVGNHDNAIYNSWWSETHHGVQEEMGDDENVKYKYMIDNNQSLAENLKGKLMLITGDVDNNVHPGGTMRMANALIKANKRFDFMLMPGSVPWFWNH